DRDLVADRYALVDANVAADVAGAAEDRAFDQGAAADMCRGVDHRARRPRPLAQRDAVREHGVGADRSARRDAAVVPDVCRAVDLLEVGDVDAFPEPYVPADADPGDVQAHVLL